MTSARWRRRLSVLWALGLTIVVGCDRARAEAGFDYQPLAQVLSNYVDERGLVDYAGLKEGRAELDAFLGAVAGVEPKQFESWPAAEKQAFWINAYNAITLRSIVDRYPIEWNPETRDLPLGIRQIPGVWREARHGVMGRQLTLDEIENAILRVEFDEPRIHAALVCAAMSCPPLRNEPFLAARLDQQLADQSRRFLLSRLALRVDRESNAVQLSQIFEWYGDDFVKSYATGPASADRGPTERAVLNYVILHVDAAEAELIASSEQPVTYLEYDWSLNEQ